MDLLNIDIGGPIVRIDAAFETLSPVAKAIILEQLEKFVAKERAKLDAAGVTYRVSITG